ncbi:polyprenol monophosphomannose synthase [Halobacteriota archaeon]
MKAIVMLPTYNEKENIEDIVREILKNKNVNILIVDDNSPDSTGQIADKLAKEYAGMVHVIHRNERGRGTAGITGFKYALTQNVDCIFEMDADFSHDPADIPRFLEEIKKYDVVIGSRYVKGGNSINCHFKNILLSHISNIYNRIILGLEVKDSSGGYKCYRKEVLGSINLDNYFSKGYSVGPETLFKIKQKKFTMKEIPIIFRNRAKGLSKSNIKIIIEYPIVVLKLRLSLKSLFGE